MKVLGGPGWVSEWGTTRSVQNRGGEVLVHGSEGVKRFPSGAGIIFAQENGPAQQRVHQFALKVSSDTFQFILSFFFFYHVELGSL